VLVRLGPAPRARRGPARLVAGLAAAAAAVAAAVAVSRDGSDVSERAPVRVADVGPSLRVVRDGRASASAGARAGDLVVADGDGAFLLGGRSRVRLERGARVALASDDDVAVETGFAEFDVAPAAGGRTFRVRAGTVSVAVLGTRFGVERRPARGGADAAGFDVAVDVLSGRVSANGISVGPGEQVFFAEGRATTAQAVARVPALALTGGPDATDGPVVVEAGKPVRLGLRLRNATGLELPLVPPGDPRAPWYVSVVDPSGAVVPVRIAAEAVGSAEGTEGAFPERLAPRASAEVVLRFDTTFSRPGAYRLRTLYLGRPAGAFPPLGPDLKVAAR
jgi:hypothetical protein